MIGPVHTECEGNGFPKRKVLKRALLRLQIGARKPFEYGGKQWTLEISRNESDTGNCIVVRENESSYRNRGFRFKDLRDNTPEALREAIDLLTVSGVMDT